MQVQSINASIKPRFYILCAVSLFLSMIFIDETGVAVTLPHIQSSLHMSSVALQWVMNALFLPLAVLVLFAGKLSDNIGCRRTFYIGMWIFIIASMLCAIAPTATWEIIGRLLQGVGASLLLATYAVLLGLVFPGAERGKALGTCASLASVCLAAGPLLAGALAHYASWRWVFVLNLPLGLICLHSVARAIPQDVKYSTDHRFDAVGLFLFVVGFSALSYGLIQAAEIGWAAGLTIGLLLLSVVLLPIFYYWERKQVSPLLDFKLFSIKNFCIGNFILLLTQLVVLSITYWALWLQQGLGFSALQTGFALLPAGLPILIMARIGGIWLDKKGPAGPIGLGVLLVFLAMLWLTLTASHQSYAYAFWGFLAYGIGAPLVISPAIALVLGSVPVEQMGMAAGIQNTMRQLGAACCFAVVGVVITNLDKWHLQHRLTQLGYTKINPLQLSHLLHQQDARWSLAQHLQLSKMSQQVYTHAFSIGMGVAAVSAAAACLLAWFGLRKR